MRIFACLFILLSIYTGFIMTNNDNKYHPSRGSQLVNSILGKGAGIIKEKYDIEPCGIGVSMPGGPIREVTLCFDTKYPFTKEQLRKMLISSAQELLNLVNSNYEIQGFIYERPFTIKNIEIVIYNNDKDGDEVYDPEICVAEIARGKLVYRTTNENDTFIYKNEFEESYEEALKILSKS